MRFSEFERPLTALNNVLDNHFSMKASVFDEDFWCAFRLPRHLPGRFRHVAFIGTLVEGSLIGGLRWIP
jgi:hypothetical protein